MRAHDDARAAQSAVDKARNALTQARAALERARYAEKVFPRPR
jgi:hypothetical protein